MSSVFWSVDLLTAACVRGSQGDGVHARGGGGAGTDSDCQHLAIGSAMLCMDTLLCYHPNFKQLHAVSLRLKEPCRPVDEWFTCTLQIIPDTNITSTSTMMQEATATDLHEGNYKKIPLSLSQKPPAPPRLEQTSSTD